MDKRYAVMGLSLLVFGCATLLCSLLIVPSAIAKPISLPQASYLITESFAVPPGHMSHNLTLSDGDDLYIWIDVEASGNPDLDFYVMDEADYSNWKVGESASPQITCANVTTFDWDWVVPHDGVWYLIYDNVGGSASSRDVTVVVTKHWTETAYREVTEHRPLIPFEFSIPSAIVLFGGVALLVKEKIVKETPVSESARTKSGDKK